MEKLITQLKNIQTPILLAAFAILAVLLFLKETIVEIVKITDNETLNLLLTFLFFFVITVFALLLAFKDSAKHAEIDKEVELKNSENDKEIRLKELKNEAKKIDKQSKTKMDIGEIGEKGDVDIKNEGEIDLTTKKTDGKLKIKNKETDNTQKKT